MDILYLDDYINIYSYKLKKILVIKPYKGTLRNGLLINKDKFLNLLVKVLKNNKINNNLIKGSITIITNGLNTPFYKENLIKVIEDLNYKVEAYISEKTLIKIDKNTLFINALSNCLLFYYQNELGKIKTKYCEFDEISKKLLKEIISSYKKKIIIVGKYTKVLVNLLNNMDIDYYYYQNYANYFIENYA